MTLQLSCVEYDLNRKAFSQIFVLLINERKASSKAAHAVCEFAFLKKKKQEKEREIYTYFLNYLY